jgi:hypothetical protein
MMGRVPENQRKRTIYLNKDLDTEVRVAAARMDKTVSAVIDEALRIYFKAKKSHD